MAVIICAMNKALTQQRVRITFGKHGALRFVGHLDLSKTWERLLRRVQIPLEYTQGFNPRPRIQFASALQVGVTSESEYLDIWLTERLDEPFPELWIERLQATSPPGLRIYTLADVPVRDKALPQQVASSEYVITVVEPPINRDDLVKRVEGLLNAPSIERTTHKGKVYDLRPRIFDLTLNETGVVIAHLSSNERANARPDELIDALGMDITQVHIHRRRLKLEDSG